MVEVKTTVTIGETPVVLVQEMDGMSVYAVAGQHIYYFVIDNRCVGSMEASNGGSDLQIDFMKEY